MNNFKVFLLVIFSIVVTGCTQKDVDSSFKITDGASLEEKSGEFSLTGKISKPGDQYLITQASGEVQELESYTVKLENYVGKTATVVGEFSGNTLFITEIK